MRETGIHAVAKKKYRATTDSKHSLPIVRWSMKNRITQELVSEALHMAFKQRKPSWGLLLHLRQGSLNTLATTRYYWAKEVSYVQ